MSMDTDSIDRLMIKLDALGEPEVRRQVFHGLLGSPGTPEGECVESWLRAKGAEREVATLSISREASEVARSASATAADALRIARQQRTLDVVAIIIATLAIIIAIIK